MKINYQIKIKDLPAIERPREKLIKYGPSTLTTTELLAILVGSGTKNRNALNIASRLLKKFSSEKLNNLSFTTLKKCVGIGPAKACEIVACFELGKRVLNKKQQKIYLNPKDVWNELKDVRKYKKEHFVVLYLNIGNQEIKREIISIGTLNSTIVHPREVFEPAIRDSATYIILAHNHPSGNLEPSIEDIKITKRLIKAGDILGIEVLDHIIVTQNSFLSLKEKLVPFK